MKTILLLGGYGFIGTNILKFIDTYLFNKFSVTVFDRFPVHPQKVTFRCVQKTYSGNFLDRLFLETMIAETKPDYVLHSLSATIPSSSNNARFDIESNLIPTVELLDLLVKYNIPNIIYISSGGAIYGDTCDNLKHREFDNPSPKSSYGIIKLAIEKYLLQYQSLYGLSPLILRLSNPYGPYHYSNRQGVINIALSAALRQENFSIWGTGSAKKDYIFINDFCEILFTLIEKEVSGKVLNVGSEQVLSLNEISRQIQGIVPSFSWDYQESNKLDVSHFELDITELKKNIGEFTFTPLEYGLKQTQDWLKNSF